MIGLAMSAKMDKILASGRSKDWTWRTLIGTCPGYRYAHPGYISWILRAHAVVILQISDDAFISMRVVARTGEDLHDFVLFADRPLAFDAYAGRCIGPLSPNFTGADRA